ncbi:DUF3349 domain-containing protein [Nocardioides hankookensis]|uniref:DUF3349 domain-containing protein n=1 Tax=Nocardioides hankookensis TaxID=443157 RepID=A0ABW1LNK1_9ACTN
MSENAVPSPGRLRGVLDWLREGYPAGIPPKDYIPLLALLRRRLTEDEVREVAREIADLDGAGTEDIGVQITKITDALPSDDDVARVEARLTEHHGWPEDA